MGSLEWIGRLRDEDVLRLLEASPVTAGSDSMPGAAFRTVSILGMAGLLLGVFTRAAERSSTSDILTWLALFFIFAYGCWLQTTKEREHKIWVALIQEKAKRGL